MKEFNLVQALAGEPVKLRNGLKAYVKYVVDTLSNGDIVRYPLRGYAEVPTGIKECAWTYAGSANIYDRMSEISIISMWEEPRPSVTLTLPCPLKKPQKDMWFIGSSFTPTRSSYGEKDETLHVAQRLFLENGRYFATKEDAQAWVDALISSRR